MQINNLSTHTFKGIVEIGEFTDKQRKLVQKSLIPILNRDMISSLEDSTGADIALISRKNGNVDVKLIRQEIYGDYFLKNSDNNTIQSKLKANGENSESASEFVSTVEDIINNGTNIKSKINKKQSRNWDTYNHYISHKNEHPERPSSIPHYKTTDAYFEYFD